MQGVGKCINVILVITSAIAMVICMQMSMVLVFVILVNVKELTEKKKIMAQT